MSKLDEAIKAEMDRQGCRPFLVHAGPAACDPHWDGPDWDEDRNECALVGAAVRAGYRAGIEEAQRQEASIYGEIAVAIGTWHSTARTPEEARSDAVKYLRARERRALLSDTEGGQDNATTTD